jgi:hypothetical protein
MTVSTDSLTVRALTLLDGAIASMRTNAHLIAGIPTRHTAKRRAAYKLVCDKVRGEFRAELSKVIYAMTSDTELAIITQRGNELTLVTSELLGDDLVSARWGHLMTRSSTAVTFGLLPQGSIADEVVGHGTDRNGLQPLPAFIQEILNG